MIEEFNYLLNKLIKNVPSHLRADCYQAGCLGLVVAHQKKDNVKHFKSYAYKCMKVEILNELAKLHDTISLDKNTYEILYMYKNHMKDGDSIELNLSKSRERNIKRLAEMKTLPYTESREDDRDWD